MNMDKKRFTDALRGYKKVLRLTKKPDRKEFSQTAKVCAIGIALVAVIGFLVKIVSSLIQGTTF
ncbi:MAG TPA: protein translocase SEC61 complex subunit gamma [Methanomicrobia archaeon]|nr:protein translocase SEC61 complex subunit gamma [Methanomicrobia archaeon]